MLGFVPLGMLYGKPVYGDANLPCEWADEHAGLMVYPDPYGPRYFTNPLSLARVDSYGRRLRDHPEWRELNND